MKPCEQATNTGRKLDRLEQINMTARQRRIARESMHQAEMIIDMLTRAHADLKQVLGFVRRVIGSVARRGKLPAARTETN